jgi:hypothetical protein
MSTMRGRVPAASAAPSSRSIRPAETPCGAAERTAVTGLARHVLDDLVVSRKAQVRQHWLQMRKELRDRRVGLAVRRYGGQVESRVSGEQPQQLTRDVAGAAENDRGSPLSHSLTACASRAPIPKLSRM